MARTKFNGPKPESPPEIPPPTEATDDGAANPPTAATGAPAPASAAKSKAPGQTRVTKRVRGTTKSNFSKDVLVLYEALTYGVDVKVNHAALARAVGINEPAARMRYTRPVKRIAQSLEDQNDESEDEIEEEKAVKKKTHDGKDEMNKDVDKE